MAFIDGDASPTVVLVSAFLLVMDVMLLGVFDFLDPTVHVGSYILAFVGVMAVILYVSTHNDKSHVEKMTVVENGVSRVEDWDYPGGSTLKTLAIGSGLIAVSVLTFLVPWLRLTSFVFLGFGGYVVLVWSFFFYQERIRKDAR